MNFNENHALTLNDNAYYVNNQTMFLKLLDIVKQHPKSLGKTLSSKKNLDVARWMIQMTLEKLDFPACSLVTRCYWIVNGIEEFPKCERDGCDNDVRHDVNVNFNNGYSHHCSCKCSTCDNAVKEKLEKTMMRQYGVKCAFQSLELREKGKMTCREKYGNENYRNREQAQQTCLMRYGHINPAQGSRIKQKIQKTNIERYGGISAFCSPNVQKKAQDTVRKNAKLRPGQTERKRIKTCNQKFGCDYPMQDPDIRKKAQTRYKFNGIKFDSSYELAMYILLTRENIDFEYQPNCKMTYQDENGKTHFYCPDFRVEGYLVELKGNQFISADGKWINPYDRSLDHEFEAKHQCCLKHQVRIIESVECEKMIKDVEKIYGTGYLNNFRNYNVMSNDVYVAIPRHHRVIENLPDISTNIYFLKNHDFFMQLLSLVQDWPRSYVRKLRAVGRKRENKKNAPYKYLKTWVEESTDFALSDPFYTLMTKVAWVLHGLTSFPACSVCGKDNKFRQRNINAFSMYKGVNCCSICAVK